MAGIYTSHPNPLPLRSGNLVEAADTRGEDSFTPSDQRERGERATHGGSRVPEDGAAPAGPKDINITSGLASVWLNTQERGAEGAPWESTLEEM